MKDFNYNVEKITGLDCPTKFLVTINDKHICFTNSQKGVAKIIKYATTLNEEIIENAKITRKIKQVLNIAAEVK